jgi:hypothetical protein
MGHGIILFLAAYGVLSIMYTAYKAVQEFKYRRLLKNAERMKVERNRFVIYFSNN